MMLFLLNYYVRIIWSSDKKIVYCVVYESRDLVLMVHELGLEHPVNWAGVDPTFLITYDYLLEVIYAFKLSDFVFLLHKVFDVLESVSGLQTEDSDIFPGGD